ncbi:class I SAM-dependent methyltransferase [Corynebacterium caspium]|nr:class I SAM-dependent methyltransferase [Corynebacterium caspium]WKD59338.1 putative methyltransferase [Corynebacterium caspium DSM 44850]
MTNKYVASYRPPSQVDQPVFRSEQHLAASARAFTHGADVYHDIRPDYPGEIYDLVGKPEGLVVDIGAGTGKLTAGLLNRGLKVAASDPSQEMLSVARNCVPGHLIPVWRATAEYTGLAGNSVELLTCAQTWHWVDYKKASAEFDRILKPGGRVILAWNTIDVTDPWILRLARIMHSGDVLREGFTPPIADPWKINTEVRTKWSQKMTFDDIVSLTSTRSYWLRSSTTVREKVRRNLEWYFFEFSGFPRDVVIDLPYRTDGFELVRQR